jgi:hypothetical protein
VRQTAEKANGVIGVRPSCADNWTRSIAANTAGWALSVAGLAAIIIRTFRTTNLHMDFAFIYVAGRTWKQGLNPYSEAFSQVAKSISVSHATTPGWSPDYWLYPFQWASLAIPLSLLPAAIASMLWQITIAINLVISVFLLWRCSDALRQPPPMFLKGLFAFLVATSDAAHFNFLLGQTGSLLFLGFACAIYGAVYRRPWLVTTGLVILLLKPQYGIAIFLLTAFQRRLRVPALSAAIISVIMAVPGFVALGRSGVAASVLGYLDTLRHYTEHPANRPESLTGLGQLFYYLGVPNVPSVACSLIGAVAGIAALRVVHVKGYGTSLAYWCGAMVILCVVGLHNYDLLPLMSIMLALPGLNLITWGWAAAYIAATYRPIDAFGPFLSVTRDFETVARIYTISSLALLLVLWLKFRRPVADICHCRSAHG